MNPKQLTSTRRSGPVSVKSAGLLGGLAREINHPVFEPGLSAIHGAVTLPVGRPLGDPRPGEPGVNAVPSLILPLAVKIDGSVFKSPVPNLKSARRRSVRPRMFPPRGLRIEGAETKTLDDRSLIRSLEQLQGDAAIQYLARCQPAWTLAPGSIG